MSGLHASGQVKSAELSVVVIRADGTVEDHGTVAYYHRNPLRRWAWSLRRRLTSKET